MNLTEAFRALDALNEDTFSVSDDGIAKLAEFQDNDDLVDEIKVMDPEATTEEELADSYVGKVILDCCVCHSKLYKDADEVALNEEGTLANVDEECPYCYSNDGFKVVGQVAAYGGEKQSTDDADDTEQVNTSDEDNKVDEGLFGIKTKKEKEREAKAKADRESKRQAQKERAEEEERARQQFAADSWARNDRAKRDAQAEYNRSRYNSTKGSNVSNTGRAGVHYSGGDYYSESLSESVNNVNVETDDSIVNVATDETGKVTVTTEPNAAPAAEGDEMIVPVDPDTQAEIEGAPVDDEFVDMDVNEFDEESFDELGESFLKETYSNVVSYKTTDVSSDGNKIVVEGVIKFDTGSEKKTSFVFEAKDATKSGKVRLMGENMQITKGKKAFTISGTITENKFMTESFNYNYRAKDEAGKSTRIYGTMRK